MRIVGIVETPEVQDSGDSRGSKDSQSALKPPTKRKRAAAVVLSPTEFDVDDDELLPDQAILDGIKAAKMK